VSAARSRGAAGPIGLIVLFAALIRLAPAALAPAQRRDECDQAAKSDLAALERCVTLRADDADLWLALGRRLEAAGQTSRAEDAYRGALRADPRNGEVQLRLGERLLARGDRAGARAAADAALDAQPRNPAAIDLARRAGATE